MSNVSSDSALPTGGAVLERGCATARGIFTNSTPISESDRQITLQLPKTRAGNLLVADRSQTHGATTTVWL